jgi:transcriptional regulator GlxA family with amidase domain
VWTSAGVTAGIDMALAMIEEDHGAKLALRTAQELVVFRKRPGGQSQFSAELALHAAFNPAKRRSRR